MSKANSRKLESHTPGPWKFIKHGRALLVSGAPGNIAALTPQREHAEANARLIAAAPELLAALKWAQVQMDRGGMSTLCINEALAKAEGRDE